MRVSFTKATENANPGETRVDVKVSADDDPQAKLIYSHSFDLKEYEENRTFGVEVFNKRPQSRQLRKYGKMLFRALFSTDESSLASQQLQQIVPPHQNGRVLLELNGDLDLDIIPWEYAWGKNAYLVHQCMFARVRKWKDLQLPKLPLRIMAVVPDPVIPPGHPDAKLPDLHLGDQFQNFINGHYANTKKVILERVFPPTVDQMDALLMNKPETATALHFMGHCGEDKDNARTLIFEHNKTGEPEFVDTLRLVSLPENLRLACDSRDVARVLFEHGVPYTIGSNCSIPDDLARKFESKFYQLLADGFTVETAMWRARVFLQDRDDTRQRDYFPGAMVLYSSMFRNDDSGFKCEEGLPAVELHMPPNNLELIPTTSFFRGRKKELVKLNAILRRMSNRGAQSYLMCTIEGISGQGKTAFAMEAMRRMIYLFPGGIFVWQFDHMAMSVIEYLWRLVEVIFPTEIQSRLKVRSSGGDDVQLLGSAIIKEFVDHPTSLLLLDHADTLKCAEAGDENAAALGKWLREVASTSNSTVKILATSSEPLGWSGEITMHLDGLTGLDIDSGVELFIRNLGDKVKQKLRKETNTTQLLQDLAIFVDGHPLCLESLGHAFGLPQYHNAPLEELVQNCSTMLADYTHGGRILETHFRPTIDALPTQQRLLLYMCSLFTGPITEGVLAFIRYFVKYVEASTERIDFSIEDIVENLQQLCDRGLLSKTDEEYKIHVALREGARFCNSALKFRLRLPIPGLRDDIFIIGVVEPSILVKSMVLEWQLRSIKSHACRNLKTRGFGIHYYSIGNAGLHVFNIPGINDHNFAKATTQQHISYRRLAVFTYNTSESDHENFPRFCGEQIIPFILERKMAFIVCLHHADTKFEEPSTWTASRLIKKAAETLRASLEKTHWIVWTDASPGIVPARGRAYLNSSTLSASNENIDIENKSAIRQKLYNNVHMDGPFVGRENDLKKLGELLEGPNRYITIKGFGGIGKTSLALQAFKNFNSGSALALSLSGIPRSSEVIQKIAEFLTIDTNGLNDQEQQFKVIQKLAGKETILLYLDNMEDVKQAMTRGDSETKKEAKTLVIFFKRLPENVKILATSRSALGWPNEELFDLGGLTPHDGMLVFRQWIPQRSKTENIDDESGKELSRVVDGHPLSLRLLGGVFDNCKESIEQFINNICNELPAAVDEESIDERHESLNACIKYTFGYLDATLGGFLSRLRAWTVPFTSTLAIKVLEYNAATPSTGPVADNLHKLWQRGWLVLRKYQENPILGDWRPKLIETDTEFYSLHPKLRDFLNEQFTNVECTIPNDAEIQFYMALCYGVGFGVVSNLSKQIEWCTKAANNGLLEAQLTLAACYQGGCGVDRDEKKAFDLYLSAAEAGSKQAQEHIRWYYECGIGVDKGKERETYWKQRAKETKTAFLSTEFDLSLPLIHRAAERGDVTLVRSLMEQSLANIDVRDRFGRTPLHVAAQNGLIDICELLISEFDADTNAKAMYDMTPLHFGALGGHVQVVWLLVAEFGAGANDKDKDGWAPIHFAAHYGHVEVAKLLVDEFGANANDEEDDGWTPLHLAAQNGDVEVVRFLVTEFGPDANDKENRGWTPLNLAAKNGNVEVVRLLVAEFGADANGKEPNGCTPLHFAARNGHVEVVRLLVAEFAADVNDKASDGGTPLHLAANHGHVEVVRLLVAEFGANANVKENDGWTPLHFVAQNGDIEVVRLLVAELGAETNDKENHGWRPLHQAAMKGHVEVVRLLVSEFGADANDKDNDGWTPLHFAADHGYVEIVRLLVIEFKADAKDKDEEGWALIHFAAQNGDVRIVRLLVTELGADVNDKENHGWTPLHQATMKGHVEVVRLLVAELGADANDKDNDGWTPLHLATLHGNVEIVRLFVTEFKADANDKDEDGWTLIHFAAQNGDVGIVRLLVTELGVDANDRENDGWTPLHLAAQNGHVEVVRLLVAKLGADANDKEPNGYTPLHVAARDGYDEVVRLLVAEFEADANGKENDGWTPLHLAAQNGHIEVVRLLVTEFGADANGKENRGWTPLHLAAKNGNVKVVRLLVAEFGADANDKEPKGYTPLHIAARNGHDEVVRLLVAEFEADANDKASDGWTPLHFAANNGHVEVVRLLVAEFEADANAKETNGCTPLHLAAQNGHIEVVRLLVAELGADINDKEKHGWTPLQQAAKKGHVEVMRLLVAEFRADVNDKDNDGWTPLHFAAHHGYVEVVRLLVAEFEADANAKNNDKWAPLHLATHNGHVEMVRLLVAEFGADANAKENDGWTPLHLAAQNGHVEVVRLLVTELGADANDKENRGWALLHLAAQNGHVEVVRLLVAEFAADVNSKESDGCTPLHLAAQNENVEVVRLLVAEFGADVNDKENDGCTPLHFAALNGRVEVVRLLVVELGANVNGKENDGWTPLHLAARNGHVEVVKLLVAEFRANPNDKKNDGLTPLHIAAQNGHVEVVRFLVAHLEADVNDKTSGSWTPLHLAAQNGHIEVVRLLVAEFGADDALGNDGDTPLLWAAKQGHANIVKILVAEFGADANVQSNNGNTPLHYAARNGHVEMVKVLIVDFGVDVNAKGEDDNTPLHFASLQGHIEVVKSLKSEFVADQNAKNKDGWTPLHLATQREQFEVVKLLAGELGADATQDRDIEMSLLGTAANTNPQHEQQDIGVFAARDAKPVATEEQASVKAALTSSEKPFTPTSAMAEEIKQESIPLIIVIPEPGPSSHSEFINLSKTPSNHQLYSPSPEPSKGLGPKSPSRISSGKDLRSRSPSRIPYNRQLRLLSPESPKDLRSVSPSRIPLRCQLRLLSPESPKGLRSVSPSRIPLRCQPRSLSPNSPKGLRSRSPSRIPRSVSPSRIPLGRQLDSLSPNPSKDLRSVSPSRIPLGPLFRSISSDPSKDLRSKSPSRIPQGHQLPSLSSDPSKDLRSTSPSRIPIKQSTNENRNKTKF